MRFAVESWSPDYGASIDDPAGLAPTSAAVETGVEVAPDQWRPVGEALRSGEGDGAGAGPVGTAPNGAPVRPPRGRVLFVDGVRRVDARVWIDDDTDTWPGLCATIAAGVVAAEPDRAALVEASVRRGLYTSASQAEPIVTRHGVYEAMAVPGAAPDALILEVQRRMAALEACVAAAAGPAEVLVVDGPLRGPVHAPNTVGYIKTQHTEYLPPALGSVLRDLAAGQRTPVFSIGGQFTRLSWYQRLPGPRTHGLAGIVRCETHGDGGLSATVSLADLLCRLLPAFASRPHKDARAPQNLYPIAGLERELRRRLGEPALLERALRSAARATA